MSPSEPDRSRARPRPISISPVRAAEPNQVRLLLERGLELFGRGELEAAVHCWRQVIELAPGHPQALDYLSAATGEELAPVSSCAERTPAEGRAVDRELLRSYLAHGNYQEAWQVLEEALRLFPDDPELVRARDLLEPRVALRIAQHMRLSMPPRVAPSDRVAELNDRQQELLRLAETSPSYAQVLARSPFGEVETLLGLRSLEELGLLTGSLPRPPHLPNRDPEPRAELDLSHVEGLTHFELLSDLSELGAEPGELTARCVAELTSALRLLGSDETLIDVAALNAEEIRVVRHVEGSGQLVAAAIDRSISQLSLARLQIELACQKWEQK